jgi:peptidoglycan/xylan/chitin deacetylase (PgdA/CDA1 family)
MGELLFNIQIDCEATEPAFGNPDLGKRAVLGLAELLEKENLKATFMVIPTDLQAHATIYRQLEAAGHEVGLHIHPAAQGYNHFLGIYSYANQVKIINEGMVVFANELGHPPVSFTPGYGSANDFTFPVLEELRFSHGLVSIPTRNLPQCACVWGNSPFDAHYPHRYNRCLTGDVNFVDLPATLDWESRMWGGAHPQDLRIELVDAKNHWYTIHKNVKRLMASGSKIPVKYIRAVTHNTFDYSDPRDFRRETLVGVIAAVRSIFEQEGSRLIAATGTEIAARYRELVPLPVTPPEMELDTRGRQFTKLGDHEK